MLNSTQAALELVNDAQEGVIDQAKQEVNPQLVEDPFNLADDAFKDRIMRALFTSYDLDDLE